MATKERAGEKLLRFPRRDTVNVSRRAFLGLAEAGVGFLLGAVLAGAELFGLYAPFGVAAVAAAGSGVSGFCTLAGTCLGYLCLEGLTDGMRYAASAILVYAVAFAFFDTKAYRTAWFMPAIASLLCALTGIISSAVSIYSPLIYPNPNKSFMFPFTVPPPFPQNSFSGFAAYAQISGSARLRSLPGSPRYPPRSLRPSSGA